VADGEVVQLLGREPIEGILCRCHQRILVVLGGVGSRRAAASRGLACADRVDGRFAAAVKLVGGGCRPDR
jgi:hypothetical protein